MLFSNDENKHFNCVIYTRISDQEPEEISPYDTIEAQRESCENFLKARPNWKLIPTHYDDRNQSGGRLDRPALQRLIQEAKQQKFNMIIVSRIDRFSRSLRQFFDLWDILEANGVNLCCASQTFSTEDATGQLILKILLTFAEFERQLASERTRAKMAFRARMGLFHGGYIPLGYKLNPEEPGNLQIIPAEAKIVQLIFEKYLEIQSVFKVAKYVNSRNLHTKTWETKKSFTKGGKKFTEGIILSLLKNPVYISKNAILKRTGKKMERELVPAKWKHIVSQKVFDRVQRILEKNAQSKGSISENKYNLLLTGLVWCDFCKSQMTANHSLKKGKPYLYYKCTKVDHSDKDACRIRSTPARELENLVIDRIKFISTHKNLIESFVKTAMDKSKNSLPTLQKEKRKISGELAKIKNRSKPLIDFLEQNKSSLVKDRLNKIEEEKAHLDSRLQELNTEIDREKLKVLNPELITQNLKLFKDIFDKLPFEKQRDLLHLLIKKIVYHEDPEKIKITLYDIPEIKMPPAKPKKGSSGGISSRFDERMNWLPKVFFIKPIQ